jgi:hypothetical protein
VGNSTNHRFDLEALEPRLLLSADGLGAGMPHAVEEAVRVVPEVVVEVETNKELRRVGLVE